MKRYADLLAAARLRVQEWMPWDLAASLAGADAPMVLDVREPAEFAQAHIPGSINVPRGVLRPPATGTTMTRCLQWLGLAAR